jgi:hypothetical protein
MRHVEIVPATMEHAGEILPRVRLADTDEFYATARFTPALALDIAIHHSTHRWAGIVDGLVVAIFSSNEVERYSMTFLRHSRPLLADMLRDYRLLENWADVRNVKACCWLHWMGFQFDEPAPFGVLGLPFIALR